MKRTEHGTGEQEQGSTGRPNPAAASSKRRPPNSQAIVKVSEGMFEDDRDQSTDLVDKSVDEALPLCSKRARHFKFFSSAYK